jgi:formate hydrogenlyase subunit 3/multisubunit Na+/H+ antiporter MnhD subunit
MLASLLLMGAAPFQAALDETALAPAALFGLFAGLVLPILSLGTLLQLMSDMRLLMPGQDLPASWRGLLLGLGTLSLLAGAAGALREHRLRRLLAWQVSAQAGIVVLSLGLESPLAALAAPALLTNLALTTICGVLAVAVFERQIGSDDFTLMEPGIDLRLPGLLWACAAASALGLPALWGFWGRRWLFAAAIEQAPWVVPPILAASVFMALAYVAPLARFWSTSNSTASLTFTALRSANRPFLFVLLLAPLLLLVPGLLPQPVLDIYQRTALVRAVEGINPMQPLLFVPVVPMSEQVVGFVVALAGVLFGVLLQIKPVRQIPADEDMTPVVLPSDALAGQLAPLAETGYPARLMRGLWASLLKLGEWARVWLAVFEQRFYLAGVLLALISLILLMAQG